MRCHGSHESRRRPRPAESAAEETPTDWHCADLEIDTFPNDRQRINRTHAALNGRAHGRVAGLELWREAGSGGATSAVRDHENQYLFILAMNSGLIGKAE